jgi:hypothetical protein
MRKVKLLSMFMLLTMLASFMPGVAMAQQGASAEIPPPPNVSELNGPPDQLSNADLKKFVDMAFAERITVSQATVFYERLTPKQKATVSDLVAIRANVHLDMWRQASESYQKQIVNAAITPDATLSSEVWRQYIENIWRSRDSSSRYASSYYEDTFCEGGLDPDPDGDWVFRYSITSFNPDGLRWTSDSAQVYLAFMTAYGGMLNGFAYNWYEARLCLGATGVLAAGGPDNVKAKMWLSPNN